MQSGPIIRTQFPVTCSETKNGKHLYEVMDNSFWCRQCGLSIDKGSIHFLVLKVLCIVRRIK